MASRYRSLGPLTYPESDLDLIGIYRNSLGDLLGARGSVPVARHVLLLAADRSSKRSARQIGRALSVTPTQTRKGTGAAAAQTGGDRQCRSRWLGSNRRPACALAWSSSRLCGRFWAAGGRPGVLPSFPHAR